MLNSVDLYRFAHVLTDTDTKEGYLHMFNILFFQIGCIAEKIHFAIHNEERQGIRTITSDMDKKQAAGEWHMLNICPTYVQY